MRGYMRVLVVGAGAVGGFFGGLSARAGVDVGFLVRPERAAALRRDGLRIAAPDGSVSTTAVDAVTVDELDGPWDVVVLSVKATALGPALEDIAPAVGPGTVLLPLLNGVGHLDVLAGRFGRERVLGGVAVVATELDSDGTVRQIAPGGGITVGELDGTLSERVRSVVEALGVGDFTIEASDAVVQDMWEKWAFMVAGGTVTVLHGGPVGEVVGVTGGTSAVFGVLAEVEAVLVRAGHPVRQAAHDRTAAVLTAAGSGFTTSLYRDSTAGRPTEVEPILGDFVALAARVGVDVPRVASAAVRTRVAERAAVTRPEHEKV